MIYTTGTIAINGNTVTGTGTDFSAPLSLIRVGCTLIAVSDPIQIFTITEIKSGTELSVTPAANPAIAAGTKFSILLSDSISVDGLAQDVAETLRYYQGKETEISEAIEFFQEFDFNALTAQINQVHTDSAQVSVDKATVQQYKTDSESAKSAAEAARDKAVLAQTAAETANTSAQAASTAAQGFRDQAEEWAQSVNADNLLTKSGNLAGLADKTASWANLMPPGPLRLGADPIADLDAATKRWTQALLNYGTAIDRWTVLSEVATKPDDGSVVEGGSLYSRYAVNGIAEADMALRIRAAIGGEYQARLGVYNRTAGRTANYDFNDRGTFSAQSLRSLGQIDSDGGITIQNQGWPGITFKSNRYASPDTQVGAMTLMEATGVDGDISTVSLIRRRGDGSSTGQIIVTFPTTAGVIALQGTSGREYKKDITDADASEAMDRINRQRLVTFVYKDDEQQRVRFGVIAEEAELIAPQYIKHIEVPVEDILDEDGNKIGEKTVDRPSVDVNPIVMDLMGCIQYLNKQVEELKAEIEAMKK